MGELNVKKELNCLVCDSDIDVNQSYSIFYTFITNSEVLLANSLEKNLSLKDIGTLPLRSNLVCLKCFGYFEELTNCESKIVKLKCDLWTVYKETCEKHGEKAETHIRGVSTQTDFFKLDCENKRGSVVDKGCQNDIQLAAEIKRETENSEENITLTDFADDNLPILRKKTESCNICNKWFKKVSELQAHMLSHKEVNKEESEKYEILSKTRKKFHSCRICNKKFRRPCEVKEHMVSHRSATPFICKYCGKKLKSKTGAIYHTLKTHKIDIGNNKKLDEHFYLDVVRGKEEENGLNSSQEQSDISDEGKMKIDAVPEDSSSSEDELPLAKRRKEFIFEKIKKGILNEKSEKSRRKSKANQKQVVQTFENCIDISVTETSKSLDEDAKKTLVPLSKEEQIVSPAFEKAESKEILRASDSSKFSDITDQSKTEVTETEDQTSGQAENSKSNEKTKGKAKKYPLSNLLKIKRQKDASLFPPPIKQPKFKCEICGKMWKTKGELNAHKITHSNARPYICEICGQAYKHKPALDVHVGMHRGIYHHQCPYCQKAFTQKGALQRHLPIHTGDLPYQCELCGKRFVHRTSFSIHTMAHTGIRNIRCKICNLGVLSKSHLRRHMRIHTGEKPYDCQTCGKAFAERYNLVAHQRIHDPNLVGPARQQKKKLQTCRLCNATFDRRHKLEDHMVSIHNKVVEDVPRTSIFTSGEGYTVARVVNDRFEGRKSQERVLDDKANAVVSQNPNDLSVRNLQGLQNSHMRNLELLRNLESGRNLELIRMANGIGSVDETLRISGTESVPWTYVNPGT